MAPPSSISASRTPANPLLVAVVKAIVAAAREGNLDSAYAGYRDLFSGATFRTYAAHEQRQALRLMVHAKGVPNPPTPTMVEAHQAAIVPLAALAVQETEPADYEMLGMCHVAVGNAQEASEAFRAGLAIERKRDLQSALCGALMRRISEL